MATDKDIPKKKKKVKVSKKKKALLERFKDLENLMTSNPIQSPGGGK